MTDPQLLSLDDERANAEKLAAWRLEIEAERQQLALERAELAAEREEVLAARQRAAADVKRLAAQRDQEESASQQPSPEDNVDVSVGRKDQESTDDDIFARLRALSVLKEESESLRRAEAEAITELETEPVAEEEIPPSEVAAAPAPHTVASPAAAHEHAGEESIDDYMTRLFARLNGGRSGGPVEPMQRPAPAPEPVVPAAAPPAAKPTPAAANVTACDIEVVAKAAPLEPLTMLPRRSAPECQVNISAMRKFANMSANSAIGASQRRRWTNSGTIKLGAAAALGIFGIAVLGLASSNWVAGFKAPVFGFGAVLFVAGALWLMQGLGLLMMAWRGGVGAKSAQKEAAEKEEREEMAK